MSAAVFIGRQRERECIILYVLVHTHRHTHTKIPFKICSIRKRWRISINILDDDLWYSVQRWPNAHSQQFIQYNERSRASAHTQAEGEGERERKWETQQQWYNGIVERAVWTLRPDIHSLCLSLSSSVDVCDGSFFLIQNSFLLWQPILLNADV